MYRLSFGHRSQQPHFGHRNARRPEQEGFGKEAVGDWTFSGHTGSSQKIILLFWGLSAATCERLH
jgi:hypothetical protein